MNYATTVLKSDTYTINLGAHLDESSLFAAIDGLRLNSFNVGHNLHAALLNLTGMINMNSDPSRDVVIIIITTGLSENSALAIAEAKALKQRENPNIHVLVIGVAGILMA